MKSGIHPEYQQSTITCACGASVVTHSTRGSFTTDVCSACHPFYTGKRQLRDTAGRVDRFNRKYGKKTVDAPPEGNAPAQGAAPEGDAN